jgi:Na+-transporting NADH:ubiquinone oxidoreductase subunit F
MEVLVTVASVSAISTLLTVLIIISERFFNNYGTCRIDINDSTKIIEVEGGTTLLSALAENKIFIPSACGGKATCGLCKLRVLDGAGPLLPTEEPYLNPVERAANVRLSCQVKVKGDLKISIPDEFFLVREYNTRIERITRMTHDILEFRFKLDKPIDFKAGQYVQVKTKAYKKVPETVFRAYSISSSPSDRNAVELLVRLVPQGICTTYMHEHLKEGDEVELTGPYGEFYPRPEAKGYVMIAGGSGLAPMRSIILDSFERGLDKEMWFFFGAVTGKDLYYVDYFKDLAKEHENLHFIPALSAPRPEDGWTGETGLITEVVARTMPGITDLHGLLCGSPGMINACIGVLKKKGMTDDRIFFDKF